MHKLFIILNKVLYLYSDNNLKIEIMTPLKITSAELLKKIELGYYEIVKQISVFKFEVIEYNVKGKSKNLLIDIK